MFPLDEANAAIAAVQSGGSAGELESETLDFKQEGRSPEDTFRLVVDAVLCFANAQGGAVVLGVSDKVRGSGAFTGTQRTPEELRRKIHDLTHPPLQVHALSRVVEGVNLVILLVPSGAEVHADSKGRAPRRMGKDCLPMSPAEVARLREERTGFDWTGLEVEREPSDIVPEALAAARSHLETLTDGRRELADLSTPDLLRALGLLSPRGRLLRAGEILLCPPLAGASSGIVYQYRSTPAGEPRRIERLGAPMVLAFQRALDSVRDRQDITQVALPTGQMLSIEDCPELAVREALANAVVHRDYRAVGPIVIEHSPSLLLVLSPGPLVSGVTPANILTHPSLPRNPALAQAFRLLGFAEEVGRGVDRMVREMIRSGRSTPHIENTPDHVRVSLPGGPPNTSIARFVAQLPKQERDDTDAMLVLHTLCAKRTVSASSMAPIIQKAPEETEAVLRRLAHDEVAMIEPTRQSAPRRRKTYRLRAEVLKALGPAVPYQRRVVDDIDRKIIAHVHEYGRITNRTVQNLFDVDVQRAKSILLHLIARELLVKTTARRGGPGIEYGPGPRFPAAKPRQVSC